MLTTRPYTSADGKVSLIEQENQGDASVLGDGGELKIASGMTFQQAVVFFDVVLPMLADYSFGYKADKEFSYLLDEVGNSAELKKKPETACRLAGFMVQTND